MCSPGNESSPGDLPAGLAQMGQPDRLQCHPANSLPGCWGLLGWGLARTPCELALWLGHSGIVAVPVPGILGSVWITTTCSRDWDLLLLAEVLWVGFLVFYLIETLSHPLSARSPGNSFHGLEGHRNPRKKDL